MKIRNKNNKFVTVSVIICLIASVIFGLKGRHDANAYTSVHNPIDPYTTVESELDTKINFTDAAAACALVRGMTMDDGCSVPSTLTIRQARQIKEVVFSTDSYYGFSNMEGLQYFINAEKVTIKPENYLLYGIDKSLANTDFSILTELTKVKELTIQSSDLADISFVSSMTSLNKLDLAQNIISDINPLKYLTNLQELNLKDNNITDFSALSNLEDLKKLDIGNDSYSTSHSAPGNHKMLLWKKYYYGENKISDLTTLSKMINLESLSFDFVGISNISGVEKLTNLKTISLKGNAVRDISALEFIEIVDASSQVLPDINSTQATVDIGLKGLLRDSIRGNLSSRYECDMDCNKYDNSGVVTYGYGGWTEDYYYWSGSRFDGYVKINFNISDSPNGNNENVFSVGSFCEEGSSGYCIEDDIFSMLSLGYGLPELQLLVDSFEDAALSDTGLTAAQARARFSAFRSRMNGYCSKNDGCLLEYVFEKNIESGATLDEIENKLNSLPDGYILYGLSLPEAKQRFAIFKQNKEESLNSTENVAAVEVSRKNKVGIPSTGFSKNDFGLVYVILFVFSIPFVLVVLKKISAYVKIKL